MIYHSSDFTVDTDFAGGNGIVDKIAGDDIWIRQDLRDTQGEWFYWAVRIIGAQGRCLKLHWTGSDALGVRGPAISIDGGANWSWLGAESVLRQDGEIRISYAVPEQATEVLMGFCPLYSLADWRAFLDGNCSGEKWEEVTLTHSKQGRPVPMLHWKAADPRARILLTCRHHACETMASYCLEGLIEGIAGAASGSVWQNHIEMVAVPFVDMDGVERGDQGKNRRPFDHNRDYGGPIEECQYPEVKALRTWASEWLSQPGINIVLDLHCPWMRGGVNEVVYFVATHRQPDPESLEDFYRMLSITPPLPYRPDDNLAWGIDWNTLPSSGQGLVSCANWAAALPGVHWATVLEMPYANAHDAEVTPATARAFGRHMARALENFFTLR